METAFQKRPQSTPILSPVPLRSIFDTSLGCPMAFFQVLWMLIYYLVLRLLEA
jgi:hypothetical protein